MFETITLGLIQGLTEFLPVSSSAHLAIVPRLIHWHDRGLAFDVALHIGSLAAVVWALWPELIKMARTQRHKIAIIILATLPGAIAGALLEKYSATLFRNPKSIALATAVMGIILWIADTYASKRQVAGSSKTVNMANGLRAWQRVTGAIWKPRFAPNARREEDAYLTKYVTEEQQRSRRKDGLPRRGWPILAWLVAYPRLRTVQVRRTAVRLEPSQNRLSQIAPVTLCQALIIGSAQALAVIPGVSRSGATITAGLFLGLDRKEAAGFSFLLSIPIIAGAGLHELPKLAGTQVNAELLAGMLTACATGFLSIRFLLKYVSSRSYKVFSVYRFLFAALALFI